MTRDQTIEFGAGHVGRVAALLAGGGWVLEYAGRFAACEGDAEDFGFIDEADPWRETLAAAEADAPWRPIEGAPRDGTLVRVGFYRPNVFEGVDGEPQAWSCVARYGEHPPALTMSNWQTEHGQGFAWTPTHWRPLAS